MVAVDLVMLTTDGKAMEVSLNMEIALCFVDHWSQTTRGTLCEGSS